MRTSDQSTLATLANPGRVSSLLRGALREAFAGAVLVGGGVMAYVDKDPRWASYGVAAASIVSAIQNLRLPKRDDSADSGFMLRIAFGMAGICTAIGIDIYHAYPRLAQGLTGSVEQRILGSLVAAGCLHCVAHKQHDERIAQHERNLN